VADVPADAALSFERDIRPLFRPEDQESMAWGFDWSSYDEVKEHATAILGDYLTQTRVVGIFLGPPPFSLFLGEQH
jgi:hypothetical protein